MKGPPTSDEKLQRELCILAMIIIAIVLFAELCGCGNDCTGADKYNCAMLGAVKETSKDGGK